MRRPERPPPPDLAAAKLTRHRSHHRDFQRFRRLQRWQDSRQARRQQRLAGARRPAHQQVVPAGRGDFEGALGDLLALDLRKVRPAIRRLRFGRRRVCKQRRPAQMGKQRQQVRRCKDFQLPGPCRFAALRGRTDQTLVERRRVKRGQQHARRRRDPPVEAQLPDRDIMRQRFRIGRPDRGKQAQRDRKIEMRSLLRQVRGRQIDRNPLGRECEADRRQGSMHPLAALGDRLVGKADDGEFRHASGKLDLHFDRPGLETQVSDCGDGRGHQATPSRRAILNNHPPSSARRR